MAFLEAVIGNEALLAFAALSSCQTTLSPALSALGLSPLTSLITQGGAPFT